MGGAAADNALYENVYLQVKMVSLYINLGKLLYEDACLSLSKFVCMHLYSSLHDSGVGGWCAGRECACMRGGII